jgi:hypothetical protein
MKFSTLLADVKLPVNYEELTQPQRARIREEYTRRQGYKCWYCKGSLREEPRSKPAINWRLFPKGFLNHPVHLHHSHVTGMTIGAVHAYCNAVLWQYYRQ